MTYLPVKHRHQAARAKEVVCGGVGHDDSRVEGQVARVGTVPVAEGQQMHKSQPAQQAVAQGGHSAPPTLGTYGHVQGSEAA